MAGQQLAASNGRWHQLAGRHGNAQAFRTLSNCSELFRTVPNCSELEDGGLAGGSADLSDRRVRSESAIGKCDRSAIGVQSECDRKTGIPQYQMAGPGAGDPATGPVAGTGPGIRHREGEARKKNR